jgi:hypothetical protein
MESTSASDLMVCMILDYLMIIHPETQVTVQSRATVKKTVYKTPCEVSTEG